MILGSKPVMAAYDLGTESGFPTTGRTEELIPGHDNILMTSRLPRRVPNRIAVVTG